MTPGNSIVGVKTGSIPELEDESTANVDVESTVRMDTNSSPGLEAGTTAEMDPRIATSPSSQRLVDD